MVGALWGSLRGVERRPGDESEVGERVEGGGASHGYRDTAHLVTLHFRHSRQYSPVNSSSLRASSQPTSSLEPLRCSPFPAKLSSSSLMSPRTWSSGNCVGRFSTGTVS